MFLSWHVYCSRGQEVVDDENTSCNLEATMVMMIPIVQSMGKPSSSWFPHCVLFLDPKEKVSINFQVALYFPCTKIVPDLLMNWTQTWWSSHWETNSLCLLFGPPQRCFSCQWRSCPQDPHLSIWRRGGLYESTFTLKTVASCYFVLYRCTDEELVSL